MTTLHGRLDFSDLKPLELEFGDMPVVSISEAQRAPMPRLRWLGTVYHGLPRTLLSLTAQPRGYLVFLGRISPEKVRTRPFVLRAGPACRHA